VAAQDSHLLEECAQKHYRQQYQQCNQFLRHKTFLIHPEVLLKEYPQLRISRATHNAGEIMLVFGGAYHEGFNCGFNIA
jgi:jumonji domain-containing protein 2